MGKKSLLPLQLRQWHSWNPELIPLVFSALTILPSIKLICSGADSCYCVRRHLHKLVYTTIVMVISMWSLVSVNEKNISSIQIDMSAKALASHIIGHRGHPGKAERATFNVAQEFVILIQNPLRLTPTYENSSRLVEMWHLTRSVQFTAAHPGIVFLM